MIVKRELLATFDIARREKPQPNLGTNCPFLCFAVGRTRMIHEARGTTFMRRINRLTAFGAAFQLQNVKLLRVQVACGQSMLTFRLVNNLADILNDKLAALNALVGKQAKAFPMCWRHAHLLPFATLKSSIPTQCGIASLVLHRTRLVGTLVKKELIVAVIAIAIVTIGDIVTVATIFVFEVAKLTAWPRHENVALNLNVGRWR
mmetsp:Transcript_26906/g.44106  ORF Transcript_26906/g.44106 Transcript_26906/m.44106 type:complete len:204 (+) Transcript_26906:749-1360(+)